MNNCSIDDDIFAISDETCFPECSAEFGEWPHVCAVLKKEVVDEVNVRENALLIAVSNISS